jgi:Holliday junction resolvase
MPGKNKKYTPKEYREHRKKHSSSKKRKTPLKTKDSSSNIQEGKDCKVVKEDGQTIQIRDIWLAINIFVKVMGAIIALCFIAFIILNSVLKLSPELSSMFTIPLVVIGGIFAIRVFNSYNKGIVVSSKYDTIAFPASDVENTIMDIITGKRVRDLANRIEFKISDIDKVWIDRHKKTITYTDRSGKKPKVKTKTVTVYTVNIAGPFGSQNIEFTSRQKRDEFRSAISICAKDLGLSLRVGSNVDMQG